jgi:hypothetical protein
MYGTFIATLPSSTSRSTSWVECKDEILGTDERSLWCGSTRCGLERPVKAVRVTSVPALFLAVKFLAQVANDSLSLLFRGGRTGLLWLW